MEFVSRNIIAMLSFMKLSSDSLGDRESMQDCKIDMSENVGDVTWDNEGYHSCLGTNWVCIYNWQSPQQIVL